MGLFSRKKKTTDNQAVPEEIRDYYEAEKRDRMWVVWLLSGATFLITVLVVLGLFWAGRWAYREIIQDDKPATVTTDQNQDQAAQNGAENQENQQQSGQSSNGQQTNQASDTSGQPRPTNQSSSTTNTSTQTPTTTPNTGPTAPELPNTGPSGDIW